MINRYVKLIFCLLVFGSNVFSQETIVWNESDAILEINQKIAYLEDVTGNLDFNQIQSSEMQSRFKVPNARIFNDPLCDKPYWIKFQVDNRSSQPLMLNIVQGVIGDVSFFFMDTLGKWHEEKNLKSFGWTEKSVNHHLNNFILPDNAKYFYIKAESRTTAIELRLMNVDQFDILSTKNNLIFIFLMGFMVFVILYNFFLFYSIRRIEYILYCLLIFGYLMFSITTSGFIHYFIKVNDIWNWYQWMPILLQPLSMYFTLVFLDIKKFPRIYKLGLIVLFYFLSYLIWHMFITRVQIALCSQIHAFIGMSLMIFFGIYAGIKGNRLGYYFAFGYTMMIIFGYLDVNSTYSGYPIKLFDINYMVIGFLFELIILSYLLTKRMEWENKDILRMKEEAQASLVKTTLENERIVKDQNIILEELVSKRTQELSKSIKELKSAQAQLIQSEKMASLGELTAGIAHEIQNPLNFVNNFSDVSNEMIEEVLEERKKEKGQRDEELEDGILSDVKEILAKISLHGKRASDIVKGMLEHSRKNTGEKTPTNINRLADEYLRLSYHGLRAKDKSFNAIFELKADETLPKIDIIPQDMGRVLLNIINNAFYAVNERDKMKNEGYQPTVQIYTQQLENQIQIIIKDNGNGIPQEIIDKIFQPFFTTKPSGQGTGLGLSLSYDIVKAHGGELKVESKEGEGTIFIIQMPLNGQMV